MKISVVGEYFSSNLGDPVIVDSVEYIIKQIDNTIEVNIVDLNGRNSRNLSINASHKKRSKIINMKVKSKILMCARSAKNFVNWIYKDKKRIEKYYSSKFKDSNLIIIAGGQLIMNNNLSFPLRLYSIIKFAKKNNIPVYFNACGIQKYKKDTFGVKILKKVLNDDSVKRITTRDDIEMLKKYVGFNKRTEKVIDSAVICGETYNIKKNIKSDIVGLGLISPDMYSRYADRTGDSTYLVSEEELLIFWKELIDALNTKNIKWRIFTNGAENDILFAEKLANFIGIDQSNKIEYIEKQPKEPKDLIKSISEFKTIISHRLHSHIIAYSLGIPSIGLIWDKKTVDFANEVGRDEFFINIKTISIEQIIKIIRSSKFQYKEIENKNNKDKVIEQIKEIIQDYITSN
jgi:polysaccharide pyruvyl transferase WcaK-like protein